MMHDNPKESDWKTFRKMVPALRERYLENTLPELIESLQNESLTPTERFWSTHERMNEIGEILRTCLDGHKRSAMTGHVLAMLRHGMMTADDLNEFSEEFRERVERVLEI